MQPLIKPALRRSWRDRRTVQYGVAPAHAVVLAPVDTATGSFLELLDGTRSVPQLRLAAAAMRLPPDTVDRLLDRLARAGLLDDTAAARRPTGLVGDRLRPDLASLSVLHAEPGGAVRRLAARRSLRVQVRGGGRVGSTVAALLSAAGVGRVDVVDGGCVEAWDTTPAGVDAEQVGERRSTALGRMVRRASPWPRVPAQREAERGPGLVVLAPRDGLAAYAPDPAEARELVATGRPHLYAGVVEGTGFVGPLVLPGSSACGECMLLGRAEREPTWPLAVGQWRSARRSGVPACDVALATVVAGAAACQALGFLDGDFPDDDAADSETADGDAADGETAAGECAAGIRTSFVLPWLRKEEELMEPYRECPCGAAGAAPAPGATGMGSRQVTMAS